MANFIDGGLPADRGAWPPGVLDAVKVFAQGDVVPCPPISYFGDPGRAVHAITRRYSESDLRPRTMVVGGAAAPKWAVITSGTCDVGEEDAKRPLRPTVQISPVSDLSSSDKNTRKLAEQGKIHYLVHLPALADIEDGFWVADLRIEYPVEKGWLASQAPLAGFYNEEEQQKVGRAVARLRERPAMAGTYYEHIHIPLGDLLTEVHKTDRTLAEAIDDQVQEWGVLADSRLEPQRVEIVLLSEGAIVEPDVEAWWRTAVDQLRPGAAAAAITVLGPRFERLDQMPVTEYRRLTILQPPSRRYSQP